MAYVRVQMPVGRGSLRRRGRLIALAASVLVLAPNLQLRAAPSWCPKGVEFMPAVGRACAMPNGLLQLEIDRGTQRYTHGADVLPAESGLETSNATPSDPTCVTDNGYRILVTYAHPAGQGDYGARAPQIRDLVRSANGRLDQEVGEFGGSGSYRVACEAGGQITVENQALSTGSVSDFSSVVSALTSLGGAYDNPKVKHWVWYEGRTSWTGVSGTGHIYDDDDLQLENKNNGNASSVSTYAIQWGMCCNSSSGAFSVGTWMHELGHNLGAVQGGGTGIVASPHSTSGGHCNDGLDIMCYADGSSNSSYSGSVCTDRAHFDCNHDDYFNPAPTAGSYLASHWNVASCFNRYMAFSYCGGGGSVTPATLRFADASISVDEAAGAATLVVRRDGSTSAAASATVSVASGSASAGTDLANTRTIVSVPAGQSSASVQIPIVDDTLDEPNETFTATLSQPAGATLATPTTATVTIVDNDETPAPPPPGGSSVTFLMQGMAVTENVGTLSVPVTRSGSTTGGLSVMVSRTGTSDPAEGVVPSGVIFPSGQSSATIPVTITDDAAAEGDETIVLSLTPTDATTSVGAIGSMTITVAASDIQPDATISASDGSVRGAGVLNATGDGQTVGANSRYGRGPVVRTVTIRHDGPQPVEILLRRSRKPPGTVTTVLLSGVEIVGTRAITIDPGQAITLQVLMRFSRVLPNNAVRSVSVTAKRNSDGLRLDVVRAQLRHRRRA